MSLLSTPFRRMKSALVALCAENSGSVAVYSAFAGILLLGSTAMVVDYGRSMVAQHQLQNYADAAATAGAAQLDGSTNARQRAMEVVNNTISKHVALADGAPGLSIGSFTFYRSLSPKVTAANDKDAKYISVTVSTETVQFIFLPLLSLLTGSETERDMDLTATSIASGNPLACAVPPLMVCDYSETLGNSYDLRNPYNVGKLIRIGKASGLNRMAPGNFGILDTPGGSQATQDIAKAMAAVTPEGCYKGDQINTAPGNKVDAVRDGINARFDMPAPPHHFEDPAPNIVSYPRDSAMNANVLGNGEWNAQEYWQSAHPGTSLPGDLPENPTRYQTYLYELNEPFAYNGARTIYPVEEDDIPAGYTMLVPDDSPGVPEGDSGSTSKGKGKKSMSASASSSGDESASSGLNGVPSQNTPVDDPRRRVIQVVMLNCESDDVKGNGGPYNANGKYFEMFITESVGQDHTIYGEIVGGISPANSSHLHANISLNE